MPLAVARIHAHEHLGPVHGLGAAGAGVDGDDGVALVVRTGEQGGGLLLVDNLVDLVELAGHVGKNRVVIFFPGETEQLAGVIQTGFQLLHGIETRAQRFRFAHGFVGLFLVGPEVGIVHARRELGQARGQDGSVKDTP